MFPGNISVYIAKERADLRKSYEGLGLLVQESLEMDPLSGLGVFSELCQSARKGSSVKKKGLTNEDSKRKTLV
ncbi:MAG: IS66 family insertion sequence element accessory protein TnpB [Alphaproteobacteria bacterium]|nr:IS66 family insertion sequence element accessory protein TnpB [Alphaproteobacteria bacterium]